MTILPATSSQAYSGASLRGEQAPACSGTYEQLQLQLQLPISIPRDPAVFQTYCIPAQDLHSKPKLERLSDTTGFKRRAISTAHLRRALGPSLSVKLEDPSVFCITSVAAVKASSNIFSGTFNSSGAASCRPRAHPARSDGQSQPQRPSHAIIRVEKPTCRRNIAVMGANSLHQSSDLMDDLLIHLHSR